MLCDELCEDGSCLNSGMDISKMVPIIRDAQKFALSPGFAAVADALSEDYTGLVKVFGRCRLPYERTWIEFAQADRPNFMAAGIQAPVFQVVPKRVGFLLCATRADLSAWKAHLFWSTELGCSCAALCMGFDMSEKISNNSIEEEEVGFNRSRIRAIVPNVQEHPGWVNASDEVKRMMVEHTSPGLADYGTPMPIGLSPEMFEDFYRIVFDLARSDWSGECSYLMAVIGLLNARNAVEVDAVDLGRLNKARTKRGHSPMLDYKVLKIHARHATKVYVNGEGKDHAPMRAAFVRGHFKERRTGIFFWGPHLRGDLKRGFVRKDYELD